MNRSSSTISRRSLIKVAGASVLGLAGAQLSSLARSQTSPAMGEISASYTLTLGELDLTLLNDGFLMFPSDFFAANMPTGSVATVLGAVGLPEDAITVPIAVLLVRAGDRTILLDTGSGDLGGDPTGTNNGKLLASMASAGIAPESVTDLVVSHWHPDHVGAISFSGQLAFPNAQIYFPRVEWDFLSGPAVGDEFIDALIAAASAKLEPALARDQVTFYGHEDELVAGLQALATPGHSPGHHSFLLSSAGRQLLVTTDVLNHFVTLEHPDWTFAFDAIPDLAVQTRRQLFGRAADERLQIFSNHFPFPGLGYVVRAGEAFRFISAA
jgi:glyoxylase-like metal-dependent hydrolase (beta-lactamase superfamily II)